MQNTKCDGKSFPTWDDEITFAKKVIDEVISKFPETLRIEALRIGCEFLEFSEDSRQDSLGGYCRSAQRIRLYLTAIKEDAENPEDYTRQLVITYLHEFGHHLGLNESGLEALGL